MTTFIEFYGHILATLLSGKLFYHAINEMSRLFCRAKEKDDAYTYKDDISKNFLAIHIRQAEYFTIFT